MMVLLIAFISCCLGYSDVRCTSAYCSGCSYDSPDVCFYCIDQYILENNGTCSSPKGKNCYNTMAGYCEICNEGYQWDNTTKSCVEGNDNCTRYSTDDGSCSTCNDGFFLENGKCTKCETNPYCILFDGSCNRCIKCKPSYGVVNGTCAQPIEHCMEYKTTETGNPTCLTCFGGYYLINNGNECVNATIENCAFYSIENNELKECKQCYIGYVFDTEKKLCVSDENYKMEGCKVQSSIGVCVECLFNYHLEEGQCIQNPIGCKRGNNNTCQECLEGYELGEDNQCYLINYYCNEEATSKEVCSKDNHWCIFETVATNTYCTYKSLNCSSWNEIGECVQCSFGFVLDSNNPIACIEKIEGCESYLTKQINNETKDVVCVSCKSGYFMKEDFTCGKCSSECTSQCYGESDLCDKDNKKCSDAFCKSCPNNKDKCEVCIDGSKPQGNWCGPVICVIPVGDDMCYECAYLSEEKVFDENIKQYIPKNITGFAPNAKGQCIKSPDDSSYSDDSSNSNNSDDSSNSNNSDDSSNSNNSDGSNNSSNSNNSDGSNNSNSSTTSSAGSNDSSDEKSNTIYYIIGGVICGILLLLLIIIGVAIIVFFVTRKKKGSEYHDIA
ncbi:CXXC-rich protein, putative [Entamoeba histolytica KU27]|uniref:CXXC-rich protein, putative n=1 Tax=Entamoeba histolytica KU27 TaxID=885311 RepID=M2RVC0_ENTHI|nr:CXXC-rich protein, putative [Entamoeba histolytica KU27]